MKIAELAIGGSYALGALKFRVRALGSYAGDQPFADVDWIGPAPGNSPSARLTDRHGNYSPIAASEPQSPAAVPTTALHPGGD